VKEKLYTVFYMVVIASVFTAGTSGVYLMSRERVELNRELKRRRVVLGVLGIEVPVDADFREVDRIYRERVEETERTVTTRGEDHPVLVGLDEAGDRLGYAFELSGRGLWDVIRGYMAVSPDLNRVLGLSWHQQNETPGLGAEITEPWFEEQFRRLELPPEPGPDGKYVELVQPGVEATEYDVDAVTGATFTSRAVEEAVNEGLASFMKTMEESQ
jgi:Na+-transporting NADH:ubiquinone oxidoreductase subunit C